MITEDFEDLKVGRKYFTAQREGVTYSRREYYIENWREKTNYTPNSYLYATAQEYYDENKAREICKKFHKWFEYSGNREALSLGTLERMYAIAIEEIGEEDETR